METGHKLEPNAVLPRFRSIPISLIRQTGKLDTTTACKPISAEFTDSISHYLYHRTSDTLAIWASSFRTKHLSHAQNENTLPANIWTACQRTQAIAQNGLGSCGIQTRCPEGACFLSASSTEHRPSRGNVFRTTVGASCQKIVGFPR